MTTHTEAAEVMAEEAADHLQAAANAPSPDEGLSAAADAVIDTTHWFTRFFETLTAGMTWSSLVLQIIAVICAFILGWWGSRAFTEWLEKRRPSADDFGVVNHIKHLAYGLLENVSFGLIAGSSLALAAWLIVTLGDEPSRSLVICRIFYSIFYAFSVLSVVMAFVQASIGRSIITRGVQRAVTVIFWCFAVLQFFGVLSDLVDYLDALRIPIGKGDMTVWKAFMAVISVLLTLAVANWISAIINQFIQGAQNLTPNLKVVLSRIVTVLFLILAVIIGLGTVGIDLTILSVFGGALGVGLGFGLQKIASNYVSGFIILLDKSIKIGDLVTVGGFRGKVVEINTRFTVVRSLDGIENIVPNEAFVTSAVLNHSYTDEANTQYVAVTIDFNADVDRALAVMLEEVSRDRPRIVKGRKPWAYVDSFGDSGINLKAAFWLADPVNGSVGIKTAITLDIVRRFREEGIRIPYNRLEVVMLDPHADDDAPADGQPKGSSAAV